MSASSVSLLLQPSAYGPRNRNVLPACRGSAPEICVWPEHQKWLGDAVAVSTALARALNGVYTFPPRVYEEGLHPDWAVQHAVPRVVVNTVPVTQASLVTGLTEGVLPAQPSACVSADPELLSKYVLAQAWLRWKATGSVGPGISVDEESLAHLLGLPEPTQKQWILNTSEILASCR